MGGGKIRQYSFSSLLSIMLHRMFDHWAHLGGAMFGFWYYFKGATLWETLRLAGEEDEGEENS